MRRVRALGGVVVLTLAAQAHAGRPPSPPPAARYTVRPGDTLARIARRLGVSVDSLARANALADVNRVRIGQQLSVPTVGEPEPPVPGPLPPLPSPVVVVGGGRTHRVERGQTLTAIARRYETTVAALATANGVTNPNRIREGATLQIPGAPWLCPVQGPRQFAAGWGQARPGGRRHLGVDIFATRGTPVVASVGGRLEHATGARAGLAFYLRGDDGVTYYGAHLDALSPPGRVERGAQVGTVGSTGNALGTTPHLHFEIKPGGGPSVDPLPSLQRWC